MTSDSEADKLAEALRRLGSMEGFEVAGMLRPISDPMHGELLARINFAGTTLAENGRDPFTGKRRDT